MPNICCNTLYVSGCIHQIEELMNHQLNFNKIIPAPTDLSADELYNWCKNNWSTSSPINTDGLFITIKDRDTSFNHMEVKFCFDTFYCPPIKIYKKLKEQSLSIRGLFFEPKADTMGIWDDGKFIVRPVTTHLPILDFWQNDIGKELNDEFSILDYYTGEVV